MRKYIIMQKYMRFDEVNLRSSMLVSMLGTRVGILLCLRGPTQKFGQKLHFFLFAEKAPSGMWEICPKILGGYEF